MLDELFLWLGQRIKPTLSRGP
jgi:hypothetical protein